MIKQLRLILFATLSLSAAIFTASCDKDMNISLDNENIDNLNVTGEDSLSSVVSTVLMPNIPTSASGAILVGRMNHPTAGILTSSSYFRLNPTGNNVEIPTGAEFDSLTLVLKPSSKRYAYGDTTKRQTITAHRLTQSLETTTLQASNITGQVVPIYVTGPAIFGQTKFAYAEEALGSVNFLPHVNKMDSLAIRLSDALGQDFFTKIKANNIAFNSEANFQDFFKGITLRPGNENTAFVSFQDTLELRVNYSYMGTDGFKKKGARLIRMGEKAYQYNQMEADRSQTAYATLSTKKPVPATATQGVTFVQGGTGVATEIKFPGLKEFMQQPGIAINKAELEIEIASSHLGNLPAGTSPILFVSELGNPVTYIAQPFTNNIQLGSYIVGTSTGRNGRYVFNMIEYIKSTTLPNYEDRSLLLSLSSNELRNRVNTTVLATQNNKPKVKLNIVYTKFK
ncbi:DUF4270 family protein [Sphingobacterium lactis]|uniref:DUF4270 domain-containing protein n=1 Tax=Sphingobacterium lactis TaxID=797291 RepID=A0A1H5SXS1_9SPHI|nr:DUF4270 family protein [Sphingobacterium lactis]SEF54587.1 protein of unknown function [Sphingobacterium lactis]